jgi:uncharacterized membrane protein
MIRLVIGLVHFLGNHSVSILAADWRAAQVARRGIGPWKGLYSIVAAIGLGLLIYGYGVARQEPIPVYLPPRALRHLAMLLMLPVFPLLLAAYLPGRLRAMVQHPMLVAVMLWAAAHLLANGTLADVLLFGGFLVWAVADRISAGRRAPAPPGATWQANDAIAIIGGLLIYGLFIVWAHVWLIGVSPLG